MALKSGIIAGIIALLLAFITEIPIYPPNNWFLSFKIFSFEKTDFYFWGYLLNGEIAFTSTLGFLPESLVSVSIWLIIFLIGLNSIMASTTKANFNNSLKLFKINILLSILILTIYGVIIYFLVITDINSIFTVIGFGYYFIVLVLILNIFAKKYLKKGNIL